MRKLCSEGLKYMLIAAVCVNGLGLSVPAFASEIEAEIAEDVTGVETDVNVPEEDVETEADNEANVTVEEEIAVDIEEAIPVEETHVITGFADFNIQEHYLYYNADERPELDDIISDMPDELEVYLDGTDEVTAIPVSWYDICEDYSQEHAYYYQFSPVWDETQYILADGIDLWIDAPYIGVFFENRSSDVKLTTSTVSGKANEAIVYQYAVDVMHVNNGVACGILANIERESGFDPSAEYVEKRGDLSYGICQWNNDRLNALKAYSGSQYTTIDGQLNYLYHEMQTTEKKAWGYISSCANTADGAYNAAYNWACYFERCISSEFATRGNLARDKYWPEYKDMTAEPKNTWIEDENGLMWLDANGQIVKNKWIKDGDEWHYLDANGYMLTNAWAKDGKGWCWLGADGLIVKKKWILTEGEWFYLNASGYRRVNDWAKDSHGWCWLDADGKITKSKWIKDNGEWYYLKANGYMAAKEWAKDSKGWCYMASSGKITKSKWIKSGGYWYYLKANGYMAANAWAKDSKGWCYMASSGKITKSKWIKSGGYWYYLKSNGYMAASEWARDSKKWYWMDRHGRISD